MCVGTFGGKKPNDTTGAASSESLEDLAVHFVLELGHEHPLQPREVSLRENLHASSAATRRTAAATSEVAELLLAPRSPDTSPTQHKQLITGSDG